MSEDFNQKFCIECQEPHSYFDCPFVVCKNCGQKGHFAGKCTNPTLPTEIASLENIRRSILTELEVQSSVIIPSTSATLNDQDIIEVKKEPGELEEDIYTEIPQCDKKCRQLSKVCWDCKVFKARGSTENLPAQSINQHFSAQFIIDGVPPSTSMIDVKEVVGNRSRHMKVIECLTPLMPGNQIVVTFQVKKTLVVTSPSVLAETFLCHIPWNLLSQNSSEETLHFSNKVGPEIVSKKSRSLSRPLSRSTRSRTRGSRSRSKDHSRTRDRSRNKDRSRSRDSSRNKDLSRTRNISQRKTPQKRKRSQNESDETESAVKVIKTVANQAYVRLKLCELPVLSLLPAASVTMELKLNPESQLGSKSLVNLIPQSTDLKCPESVFVNHKKMIQIKVMTSMTTLLGHSDAESIECNCLSKKDPVIYLTCNDLIMKSWV